jgi:hypothetical protein
MPREVTRDKPTPPLVPDQPKPKCRVGETVMSADLARRGLDELARNAARCTR